ncbi:ABC transporter substrate-binding protein [Bradyrhizobium sp. 190]|uniref:ABC transporter substrate-binding protein n=1 Tax=Bradyrhizobium sp. 190 TaxID=2782658 RepID=UPI001FF7BBED|nr:ABC transporter substrate-binding protein [Bradyrhizobium sp. 190]MCK1513195.1 ABC transporter substrate-binding protein [Bradyrhizobium sp. 190]
MKFSRSRRLITLGVMLGANALLHQTAQAQGNPLVFGVILPQSGAASQYAGPIQTGLEVAQKQINDAGGIAGRKLEIVYRDSGSTAQRALLAARELVEERKVDILYPEAISGLTLAVLPYTSEKKILTITQGTAPKIGDAKEFPYSFQMGDVALKRAPAIAAGLRKVGGKKVGILVSTNPSNLANGEQLKSEIPAKGMEVVGMKTFSPDAKDLGANLQSLRDAGADSIAFDSTSRESIRALMVGLQTLSWKAPVVSGNAALSGDLTSVVPTPVSGQFHAIFYRAGTRMGGSPNPDLQIFVSELRKLGPIPNFGFSLGARDLVYTIKWGVEKAAKMPGGINSDNIKAAFESIGTATDYSATNSLALGNPAWTKADHTSSNADYSKFWGLVRTSAAVDGMYEGEELNFKD